MLIIKILPIRIELHSQDLTELAIILDYKRPWMLCLALQPDQKSGRILPFEVVLKLKLPKNHFNKKCACTPKILFLNEKISEEIR